jgi:hypothetical protein
MSDVNLTLYRTGDTSNNYGIQFSTNFDSANYQTSKFEIVSTPLSEGDTLAINLYISSGRDLHIVHDVNIGGFTDNISKWVLEVQYIDEQGIVKKKVKTEQAKADSEPRPIDQNHL